MFLFLCTKRAGVTNVLVAAGVGNVLVSFHTPAFCLIIFSTEGKIQCLDIHAGVKNSMF